MRIDRREETLRVWRKRHGLGGGGAVSGCQGDVRPRSRHRAPTPSFTPPGGWRGPAVRRVALAALALCGAGITGAAVWRSYSLHVTRGSVRGNERLSADAIYAAAGIDGRHMLAVDWGQAAHDVRALEGVSEARVRPEWPGGASIEVQETPLVLTWFDGIAEIAVDAKGSPNSYWRAAGVPRVMSDAGMPLGSDGRLRRDVLAAAMTYAARFGDLAYDEPTGFSASVGGWLVRLGCDPDLAEAQFATLDALAGQLPVPTAPGGLIDLRFPLRPFYRISGEAP